MNLKRFKTVKRLKRKSLSEVVLTFPIIAIFDIFELIEAISL